MSLPNINALSDNGLLSMYGRAKTNVMLSKLFNQRGPSAEVLEFVRKLSEEISERGLDRGPENADY